MPSAADLELLKGNPFRADRGKFANRDDHHSHERRKKVKDMTGVKPEAHKEIGLTDFEKAFKEIR